LNTASKIPLSKLRLLSDAQRGRLAYLLKDHCQLLLQALILSEAKLNHRNASSDKSEKLKMKKGKGELNSRKQTTDSVSPETKCDEHRRRLHGMINELKFVRFCIRGF
jgi:hypothetical protein